jgi:hypothetical protein
MNSGPMDGLISATGTTVRQSLTPAVLILILKLPVIMKRQETKQGKEPGQFPIPLQQSLLRSRRRAIIVRQPLPGSGLQFFAVVVHVRASVLI